MKPLAEVFAGKPYLQALLERKKRRGKEQSDEVQNVLEACVRDGVRKMPQEIKRENARMANEDWIDSVVN